MKNTVKIILSSLLVLLFFISYAQEDVNVESKKQRKEEKAKIKKEKEAKEAADWLVYQKLAKEQEFVIVFNKIGNNIVTKRLNFLYANGDDIILQFETNGYLSENGLGGRTINGTISNYKYKPPKNDNKPIFINFDITSKFDQQNFNISITVYSGGITLISMGSSVTSIHGVFSPIEDADINLGVDMRN